MNAKAIVAASNAKHAATLAAIDALKTDLYKTRKAGDFLRGLVALRNSDNLSLRCPLAITLAYNDHVAEMKRRMGYEKTYAILDKNGHPRSLSAWD